MKSMVAALLASAVFAAVPAAAQSVFDGTWKGDPTSAVLDQKPDEFSVKSGMYACKTCIPAFSVKADGAFHAVKDKPYWDEIAVKVIDERTVGFQYRKGGKVIAENTQSVSADGNVLTNKSSNTNNAAGAKVEQTSSEIRVGSPVAGAHLVSGSWKPDTSKTQVSENAMQMTLKVADGMLKISSPMGETLDAKIGGDFTENVGDPGKTMTKVEMPSPNVLKLTDKRGTAVVQVSTYTVNPDGKTMTAEWMDPRDGSKGRANVMKQ